jgi:hypothetical protein
MFYFRCEYTRKNRIKERESQKKEFKNFLIIEEILYSKNILILYMINNKMSFFGKQ